MCSVPSTWQRTTPCRRSAALAARPRTRAHAAFSNELMKIDDQTPNDVPKYHTLLQSVPHLNDCQNDGIDYCPTNWIGVVITSIEAFVVVLCGVVLFSSQYQYETATEAGIITITLFFSTIDYILLSGIITDILAL
jgi:hypothetical protein